MKKKQICKSLNSGMYIKAITTKILLIHKSSKIPTRLKSRDLPAVFTKHSKLLSTPSLGQKVSCTFGISRKDHKSWLTLSLKILPKYLGQVYHKKECKKVKYKNPSKENQLKAHGHLNQQIPSSCPSPRSQGQSKHLMPPPELDHLVIYTYCCFQVMLHLLALLQKRGRKL